MPVKATNKLDYSARPILIGLQVCIMKFKNSNWYYILRESVYVNKCKEAAFVDLVDCLESPLWAAGPHKIE